MPAQGFEVAHVVAATLCDRDDVVHMRIVRLASNIVELTIALVLLAQILVAQEHRLAEFWPLSCVSTLCDIGTAGVIVSSLLTCVSVAIALAIHECGAAGVRAWFGWSGWQRLLGVCGSKPVVREASH